MGVDYHRPEHLGYSERALKTSGLLGDRHLTYQRTASVGLSRGLNEGIRYARGGVVAFTADDCLVPLEWAAELVRQFAAMPDPAVSYASVLGPPDAEEGWILEFRPLQEGFVRLSPRNVRSLGLTANLSVRRSALAVIGPFDEFLGVGGTFGAAEDTDFGYRAAAGALYGTLGSFRYRVDKKGRLYRPWFDGFREAPPLPDRHRWR